MIVPSILFAVYLFMLAVFAGVLSFLVWLDETNCAQSLPSYRADYRMVFVMAFAALALGLFAFMALPGGAQ